MPQMPLGTISGLFAAILGKSSAVYSEVHEPSVISNPISAYWYKLTVSFIKAGFFSA